MTCMNGPAAIATYTPSAVYKLTGVMNSPALLFSAALQSLMEDNETSGGTATKGRLHTITLDLESNLPARGVFRMIVLNAVLLRTTLLYILAPTLQVLRRRRGFEGQSLPCGDHRIADMYERASSHRHIHVFCRVQTYRRGEFPGTAILGRAAITNRKQRDLQPQRHPWQTSYIHSGP